MFDDHQGFDEACLHIDGDILIFKMACIKQYNYDTEECREQLVKLVRSGIAMRMKAAGATSYRMFLTTSHNYRDLLVDNYKDNRKDLVRPVNLGFLKNYAVKHMGAEYKIGFEADDLLRHYQTDESILFSEDKDLRQVAGKHLLKVGKSYDVVEISKEGKLEKNGNKIYFEGDLGLHYQALVGDPTDYIIGCGVRPEGERRKGVGPASAFNLLDGNHEDAEEIVAEEYFKRKDLIEDTLEIKWESHMENQYNLVKMTDEIVGDWFKMWTHDNREEWFNARTGERAKTPTKG